MLATLPWGLDGVQMYIITDDCNNFSGISKISGNIASIDKVVGRDGKPGKPLRLPIDVLKPVK